MRSRHHLLLAFVAVLLAISGNIGLGLRRDYHASVAAGRADIHDMAAVVEYHLRRTIEEAGEAAEEAAGAVETAGGTTVPPKAETWRRLRETAEHLPGAEALWVTDARGDVVLDTTTPPGAVPGRKISVADSETFRRVRDGEELVISPAMRPQSPDGPIVFMVARPLARPDGVFRGMVAAILQTDSLTTFFDLLGFSLEPVITIFRSDGAIVARRPDMEKFVGSRSLGGRLFTAELPKAPKGDFDSVSPLDGKMRFASYRTLPDLGLVVYAAVEPRRILTPWRDRALRAAGQGAFSLLVVLAIAGAGLRAFRKERAAQAGLLERLRDRDQKLAAIVAHSPAALYLKDRTGRYLLASPGLLDLLGAAEEEVIGKTDRELFGEENARQYQTHDQAVLDGKDELSFEEHLRRGDQVRTYISHKFPVLDEDGALLFIGGVSLDVTEKRRMEQETLQARTALLHASRLTAIGEVASTIAHEVNQPLGAVINYLQAAQALAGDDCPLAQLLGKARDQARRASETVRKVRSFAANRALDRRPEALAPLIEDACSLALLGAEGAGIDLSIRLPDDLPPVLIDRIQIQQVLLNLVRNAAEALAEAPLRRISVTAARAGDIPMIDIIVADSGPGLSEKIRGELFSPFATTKIQGTGLGLSTSRAIALAHGGGLELVAVPQGTAFKLSLPVALEQWTSDCPAPSPSVKNI